MTDTSILVVTEDANEAAQLTAALTSIGYQEPITSHGGANAWALLKSADVHCVIAAYNMEEMSGLALFEALVNQKENPEYYFNIGYIKTAQNKHSEAIEAFSKATQLDRLFVKAYEAIARADKAMGEAQKAEAYMQTAAEIYMDTDKLGSAEELLNELLESGTNSLNVFNTLGVLYRKKGNTEQALKQYKKALKIHPNEPYIYYNIGRLYLDIKDTARAKTYFEASLDKDQDFDEARQVIKAIALGLI